MRRVNIQEAFVGEPDPAQEGLEAAQSDEALILSVRGGELTIVVPTNTPDDRAIEHAKLLRGTLTLENERVLTFEVHTDSIGVLLEDEPARLHEQRVRQAHAGLSTITGSENAMGAAEALARDIMTASVITVTPDVLVSELAQLLTFHRVSGLPVVDAAGHMVGIVSEADIIAKRGETVADIMTPQVIGVQEDTPVSEIAALLSRKRIKRVPVMQGENVVGIVSRADIVASVARGTR
jgi:tRNA nucleotidyltransferase (CCA-adding enzyme)